jgi:F-type H+-transporting ATPase subunit b
MHHVFAQLLLAAEEGVEGEGGGGVDLLLPAAEELIAGVIAFAIVFFFVWKWAIPVLNKALDARAQAVRDQLDAADAAKVEAESLLRDYREQLATARAEAAQIVDEARQAAEAVRAEITARAEVEAEQIRARAREETSAERARLTADLRRQVADLSLDVAEKVVQTTLDRDAQRRLVDGYIEELGGLN